VGPTAAAAGDLPDQVFLAAVAERGRVVVVFVAVLYLIVRRTDASPRGGMLVASAWHR
jgi:hypothetical protein